MDLNTLQIVGLALVVVLSTTIQTAVGFGSGLFMVPIVLWLGLPLPHAVAFTAVATFGPMIATCCQLRRHIRWKEITPINVMRVLFSPLGVGVQYAVIGAGKTRVQQIIGGLLLAVIVSQWAFRVKPRRHIAWGWSPVVAILSAILGGFAGMSGPPLVLWVMAHRWPSRAKRSSLLVSFAIMVPVIVAMLFYTYGRELVAPTLLGLCFSPISFFGSWIGHHLGHRMPRPVLKRISLAFLVLVGVSSIAAPFLTAKTPSLGTAPTTPSNDK